MPGNSIISKTFTTWNGMAYFQLFWLTWNPTDINTLQKKVTF